MCPLPVIVALVIVVYLTLMNWYNGVLVAVESYILAERNEKSLIPLTSLLSRCLNIPRWEYLFSLLFAVVLSIFDSPIPWLLYCVFFLKGVIVCVRLCGVHFPPRTVEKYYSFFYKSVWIRVCFPLYCHLVNHEISLFLSMFTFPLCWLSLYPHSVYCRFNPYICEGSAQSRAYIKSYLFT